MKEKIKQLLQGTKEDMIIACSLLADNYDVREFMEEKKTSTISDTGSEDERPQVVFKGSSRSGWVVTEGTFYYQIKAGEVLLCSPGFGICYCSQTYNKDLEVINHS